MDTLMNVKQFYYKNYSTELKFAYANNWNTMSCAYCGKIGETEGTGCAICGRKNCTECVQQFGLSELLTTDGVPVCPPPHLCSKNIFYAAEDSETLFGKFGLRRPTEFEAGYVIF
jgi:hypothetical protein